MNQAFQQPAAGSSTCARSWSKPSRTETPSGVAAQPACPRKHGTVKGKTAVRGAEMGFSVHVECTLLCLAVERRELKTDDVSKP